MKSYLSSVERDRLVQLVDRYPILRTVDGEVRAQGGLMLIVGGAVRDIILGRPVAEIDVEIYHLTVDAVAALLSRHGLVSFVGKSFGVFKLAGIPIDWSLPRLDESGRKPHVTIVKDLPIADALRRRDLTMNAMAIDLATSELIDPWGGRADMAAHRLRTPDPAFFVEDPLRFYRVMQFIGRFAMYPDPVLQQLCQEIELHGLSRERISAEFEKLLLRAPEPSRGLRWLVELGRLEEMLPEVAATQGIPQEPSWHPEGDVFEHTMQAIDAAAAQPYDDQQVRRLVIYAALCHDLGKVTTTQLVDGRLRSIGHEAAGVAPTRTLLQRISLEVALQKAVVKLVRHHMAPGSFIKGGAKDAAYKRLARMLMPETNLATLALLAYADKRGRNPESHRPLTIPLPEVDQFIARADALGVLKGPEVPLISGADLVDVVSPGPRLGALLKEAYALQLDEGIGDKAILLKLLLKRERLS